MVKKIEALNTLPLFEVCILSHNSSSDLFGCHERRMNTNDATSHPRQFWVEGRKAPNKRKSYNMILLTVLT